MGWLCASTLSNFELGIALLLHRQASHQVWCYLNFKSSYLIGKVCHSMQRAVAIEPVVLIFIPAL